MLWITSAASCFLLFVLFIKAASLPVSINLEIFSDNDFVKGAATGLTYLFHPDWSKLVDHTAWVGKFTDLCKSVFDGVLNVQKR